MSILNSGNDFTKNAFKDYENVVADPKSSSLFGKLKSGLLKSAKDFLKSTLDSLTNSIKSINISKKSGANTSKLKNLDARMALTTLASTGKSILSDITSDALTNLKNASVTMVGNVLEDFVNNFAATIYIPDNIFVTTIKSLYYTANADLAYNSSYIRNTALKRDWNYTLEFLDGEYGITYSVNYSNLSQDVNTCAKNSCCKNLYYIYKHLYNWYKLAKFDADDAIRKMSAYESVGTTSDPQYIAETKVKESCENYMSMIRNLMVKGVHDLIVYSKDNVSVSQLKKFFNTFNDIIKPKYYGETDDLYGGKYKITLEDCKIMMPPFTQHQQTNTDKYVMGSVSETANNIAKSATKLRSENAKTASEELENIDIIAKSGTSDVSEEELESMKRKAKTKELVANLRAKQLESQTSKSKTLTASALSKGSKGIYTDSRARYPMQNASKDTIKYRSGSLNQLTENLFSEEGAKYVMLRNANIKQIYIMLSSEIFWKDDVMVNTDFYNRCQIPTMTSLKSAADKAKGILGTSIVVQSLYDLSDAIDGSAYRYLKKMEDKLFDPNKHTYDSFSDLVSKTFSLDKEKDEAILPSKDRNKLESILGPDLTNALINSDEDLTDTNGVPNINYDSLMGENGTNSESADEIEKELSTYPAINVKLKNSIKYIVNISAIEKRNMIIKYLEMFYDLCADSGIPKDNYSKAFANLCIYVFNKGGISEPVDLETKLFEFATDDTINENIKVLLGLYELKLHKNAMKLSTDSYGDIISDIYSFCMNVFNLELRSFGFTETAFKYDREYLASLLKQTYIDKIEYLKTIADVTNELFDTFYEEKDKLTETFEGYDRKGIIGYNDVRNRIQYTNIEVGDWSDIKITPNGTFIIGNETTPNNGIRILDEGTKTFVKTNITSGNWKQIINDSDTTFFINNDDNSIYYWTGSKIIKTNVTDVDKWDIYSDNSSKLMLFGKENNGVKYWNGNLFVELANVGSGWKLEKLNVGGSTIYVLYPTKNSGYVYIGSSPSNLSQVNGLPKSLYNSFISKPIVTTYTSQSTTNSDTTDTNDGESDTNSGETSTVTITTNYHKIFVGCNDGSYYIDVEPGSISNISSVNKLEDNMTSSTGGCVYLMNLDNNRILYVSDNNLKIQQIASNITVTTSSFDLSESDMFVGSAQTVHTFTNDKNEAENVLSVNVVGSFGIIEFPTLRAYRNNKSNSTSVTLIEKRTGEFIENELDDRLLFKTVDNIFSVNGSSYESILSDDDISVGWKMYFVNNRYLLSNGEKSLGIRILVNYKAVATNITSGFWKFGYSDDYIYAFSYNGSDSGIRCANKNNPYTFTELPEVVVNTGDYSNCAYDPSKEVIYFSSDRSKMVQDLNKVIYDIDEYIYPLFDYQIKKKLEALSSGKTSALMTSLKNKFNASGTGSGGSGSGSDGSGSDTPLTQEQIKAFLDSLNAEIERIKAEQNKYEINSNLYTDMLTAEMANLEFDVTDDKTVSNILLGMVVNSSDPNYDALIRYYAINRNAIIAHHFNDDGTMIESDDIGTPEWNINHNTPTYDYLNSDEDGEIY